MNKYTCGDPAALAGYLYDDCDAAERQAIETHLAVCAACAAEVAALADTRAHLASWTPPDVQLGFRVVPASTATVLTPARWWRQPMPAWAQAVAAMLIFAAGAAIGTRTADQTAVMPRQPAPVASTAPTPTAAAVSASDLAALEQRLRREMLDLRTGTAARSTIVGRDDDRVLQQVRTLLAESERRQDREMALRLAQVVQDFDSQRRVDLTRIERSFGQMEGLTGAQAAEQRQMINYLMRVSQRPQ